MRVKIQTIKDIRLYLKAELEGIYPEREIGAISTIVTKFVTGNPDLHSIYMAGQGISSLQASEIIKICSELKTGRPVQYIIGETTFYDCKIRLDSSTLIPRPETEELADLIINENRGYSGNIIDLGTGSGCIAIALAANLPGAKVTGTDISGEALQRAAENAGINNVDVSFITEDILDPDTKITEKAGIIVSNPPYVRESEKQLMHRNVLDFEPPIALFVPDSDPLVFYRAILERADRILLPGGKIYFEINEAMGKAMITLLESYSCRNIEIVRDLNGKERIIKAKGYV
jgi:release factor glutamine methyltransferase